MGGAFKRPPPAGGGKSRGPAGRGLTRALEGGLRITPSGGGGGGHIMPPPSISAPMRASATNFEGYLGPY